MKVTLKPDFQGRVKTYPVKRVVIYDEYGDEKQIHHSTIENFTFTENLESEDTFDNLVYVAPVESVYIPVDSLSDEQKEFLDKTLCWYDEDRLFTSTDLISLVYCFLDEDWFLFSGEIYQTKIHFNDLFKEK